MEHWTDILRDWSGSEPFHILLIVAASFILYHAVKKAVPQAAAHVRAPGDRFYAMPWVPLLRLVIIAGTIALIVPLVITPTRENILALLGASALAVGFALKDYISALFAGLLFLAERPYRVGDWIEVGGTYGEVTELGLRAMTMVTADDNTIIIPHSTLWSAQLLNATAGQSDLLCVIDFYVDPDHGKIDVRPALVGIAKSSPYFNPDRPVKVVMFHKPYGLYYKLKAYPRDARDQFDFITDVTERGLFALRDLGLKPVTAPMAMTVK